MTTTAAALPLPAVTSRRPRLGRLVAYAFLLGLFVLVLRQILTNPEWQADARLRHYIAVTWQAGLNPYDPAAVSQVAGEQFNTAYVYPPDVLPLCGLFSGFGLGAVRPLYLGFQLVLLGALLVCWGRFFLDAEDRVSPLFFLLCLLGLNGTLFYELRSGNISLLEQVLLWWGLAAWLRGRHGLFAVLLWLAAACKLTPLAFSVLLLLPPVRRWGLFAAVWLTMFLRLGLDWLCSPRLFGFFVQSLGSTASSQYDVGRNNPCLQEVLRDVFLMCDPTLDRQELNQAMLPVYAVLVLVVFAVSWLAWRAICRRQSGDMRGRQLVFLTCLAYALTVPRMKDYSYLLLLPVVWQVGKWFLARDPRAWLLFPVGLCLANYSPFSPVAIPMTFLWLYLPYAAALAAWGLLVHAAFTVRAEPPETAAESP